MANKKEYSLDVTATLLKLKCGDKVTFKVAGNGQEVSIDTLRTLKSRHHLPIEITIADNATKAIVTRL